jgi:serine/threonine protein kinase
VPTRESGVIGDRYVLGEVIGRGGMADVYRGEDRVLGRPVAVKVMREVAADPRERARFAGEARTLARLNHPGLVPVLDAGTSQERPYLVMELVEGPSLAECCRGVALGPPRVAAIGAELATALAYVHASGVVHRDIKPSNVLLDRSDRVRLTDFGIARLLSDTSGYTATGTTIGTSSRLSCARTGPRRTGRPSRRRLRARSGAPRGLDR